MGDMDPAQDLPALRLQLLPQEFVDPDQLLQLIFPTPEDLEELCSQTSEGSTRGSSAGPMRTRDREEADAEGFIGDLSPKQRDFIRLNFPPFCAACHLPVPRKKKAFNVSRNMCQNCVKRDTRAQRRQEQTVQQPAFTPAVFAMPGTAAAAAGYAAPAAAPTGAPNAEDADGMSIMSDLGFDVGAGTQELSLADVLARLQHDHGVMLQFRPDVSLAMQASLIHACAAVVTGRQVLPSRSRSLAPSISFPGDSAVANIVQEDLVFARQVAARFFKWLAAADRTSENDLFLPESGHEDVPHMQGVVRVSNGMKIDALSDGLLVALHGKAHPEKHEPGFFWVQLNVQFTKEHPVVRKIKMVNIPIHDVDALAHPLEAKLALADITVQEKLFPAGERVPVSFAIENTGESRWQGVEVVVSGFGVDDVDHPVTVPVPDLAADEKATVVVYVPLSAWESYADAAEDGDDEEGSHVASLQARLAVAGTPFGSVVHFEIPISQPENTTN